MKKSILNVKKKERFYCKVSETTLRLNNVNDVLIKEYFPIALNFVLIIGSLIIAFTPKTTKFKIVKIERKIVTEIN